MTNYYVDTTGLEFVFLFGILAATFVLVFLISIISIFTNLATNILSGVFALSFIPSIYFIKKYRKGAMSTSKEKYIQRVDLSCVFCKEKFDEESVKYALICSNCGNKAPYCAFCDDRIYDEDEKYQVEPCMHMFHRVCVYDKMLLATTCPQCNEKINEINIAFDDNY